jgi:hypothetical protein
VGAAARDLTPSAGQPVSQPAGRRSAPTPRAHAPCPDRLLRAAGDPRCGGAAVPQPAPAALVL